MAGTTDQTNIAEAIQEVSDKAQILVREEIELAKAEVTLKVTKLARGVVIAIAASVFAIFALSIALQGFAWLAWWAIPFPGSNQYFWGFFLVAALLLILGGLAGYLAARAFKAGAPPAPELAIEEAKRIRETVQSPHPEQTI
jgi:H+/Cl- antiporter ClcA